MSNAIPDLKGKQVLITGAGSGIGRAAALAFAGQGANLVISDINPKALELVKREIEALGVSCLAEAVDVSSEAAMKAFADTVHARVGALDVLINNAGIGYLGKFLQSDLAHWPRVLGVNVMGVVHGCYFFIPKMLQAGGPRQVLIVSSSSGNYPSPSMAAYAVSKFGVWGLAEVLKMELDGTNVGITTVCPGVIKTPIIAASAVSPSFTKKQLDHMLAYYEAEGCSPEVVANDMLRAVRSGQDFVLTGPYARAVHHARRASLGLVRRLAMSGARKIGFL